MLFSGIKCDDCGNVHHTEMIYDVENLPANWYTVTPGQGGGFVPIFHFCSIGCLRAWAIKQYQEDKA